MATKSTIWYKDPETNNYKGVYCHWDGYPSNNGKLLLENYNSLEKVKELVSLGFLSSLREDIKSCEFYHRDMDEDFNSYEVSSKDEMEEFFESYTYIFEDNKWLINDYDSGEFIELTTDLCLQD